MTWVRRLHHNHNAGYGLREAADLAVANGLDYASALRALTVNRSR